MTEGNDRDRVIVCYRLRSLKVGLNAAVVCLLYHKSVSFAGITFVSN
jgi:hypothetical protein